MSCLLAQDMTWGSISLRLNLLSQPCPKGWIGDPLPPSNPTGNVNLNPQWSHLVETDPKFSLC